MSATWRRDWTDLKERLRDLGDLSEEITPDLDWGRFRFLYSVTALMAADAATLARELEAELVRLAGVHGVELPPLDVGGGEGP
ncbi:hypothetical protein ACWC5I_30175 [Kitasatospora sp. NPDC001574]